jgi:hypothetical protein
MAREWTTNDLDGASREFLCASRVSPEFGLLCAQVACVVFFFTWRIPSRKHLIIHSGDEWNS